MSWSPRFRGAQDYRAFATEFLGEGVVNELVEVTQCFPAGRFRPAAPAETTIEAITWDILEAQRKGGEAILTIGNRA